MHVREGRELPGDVYIGRPSLWGNPFVIGRDGTRAEVIEKYRLWLEERPELIEELCNRRPVRLRCYCAPLPCHGDVLAAAVEQRAE